MNHIPQIAIVGTGLLGASVGLGLKATGYTGSIVGVARRLETAAAAKAHGAIDCATTDLPGAVAASRLVIVAVPLGGFDAIFQQLAPCDHSELVITDVGSTKQSVLAAARQHLPDARRFVGSHPMAGSEQQGPAAARADLFRGKPCILTPEADTDPAALKLVESVWQALGMKLLHMSALEHDQQVAATSHLPHAAAALLVHAAMKLGGWDVASTGFHDTTRLASSNPPMRADILMANRAQMLETLRTFVDSIEHLATLLEHSDRDAILKLLEEAQSAREQWLQQRGAE